MTMRYLPGNAQHIGARHSQQDSFGFADPDDQAFIAHGGFLAVVCDGMGGMEHGDAASRAAVKAFLDAYARKTPDESIPAALERAVRIANDQVVALAHNLGMSEGVGTTLVAAALLDTSMYFISVGDSGLFHASGGQMQAVNRPHIFANVLDAAVARGTMSREDAENHPERESLTSYIGTAKLTEIDRNVEPWPLRDGDTILLASDGMFKTLENEEILACLQGNPQSWADTLVRRTLAKEREYQDNVTVLSVTVESEARAAMPRTVVVKPPPAVAVGTPVGASLPAVGSVIAPAPPPLGTGLSTQPPRARRGRVLAVLLILAAIAGGGWWWRHKKLAVPDKTDRTVRAPLRNAAPPPTEPKAAAPGAPVEQKAEPLPPGAVDGDPPAKPAKQVKKPQKLEHRQQ
jgi:protein phosphatase